MGVDRSYHPARRARLGRSAVHGSNANSPRVQSSARGYRPVVAKYVVLPAQSV